MISSNDFSFLRISADYHAMAIRDSRDTITAGKQHGQNETQDRESGRFLTEQKPSSVAQRAAVKIQAGKVRC
jgi:hypothetical protein